MKKDGSDYTVRVTNDPSEYTMRDWMIICVESATKFFNLVLFAVALAVTLYSLSLLILQFHFHTDSDWFLSLVFLLAFLSCPVSLCGYCSAHLHHHFSLYTYMMALFMYMVVEVHVFFEFLSDTGWSWEDGKPSIYYDLFKKFVRSNVKLCKWTGLSVLSVELVCLLLSIILCATDPCGHIDEYDPPLLS